ncbi:MFS transporter [Bacillus gaemokensis]|uniref:Macrolide transporter n=1 Tax=Bacillus gaemokensis TaxID=574375 RepID=A0A073KE09_9BACI|nr:MFS transporter [Bacillus gaemokensis]KEK24702.1 macrolide transporter [Bacillus gaemokensis]KYG34523.1 macrolide transporter [Bacillus gaemokensis]
MPSHSLTYRQLLKHNSEFKKLFYAQTLSVLGDWFHTIALLTFVYSATQSPFMLALTFMSKSVPQLLLSPFIGAIVDRFSKKKIMILADVLRGVIVLTYLLVFYKIEIIFIANILLAILSSLFSPAKQASIKSIVKQDHLVTANSLSGTMDGFMAIMGASLGGMTAQMMNVEAAFFINSVSFFISALLIYKTKILSYEAAKTKKAFFTDMKEGFTYILNQKIILTLILIGISWGIIGGAYQLLLTIYAESIFHVGNNGIGILYAVQGAGLMIGSLFVNHYISSNENRMKKAFGLAYLWQGIFFLCFVLSDQLIIGIITLLGMRIAGGIIIPLDTTLLQTYTKESMVGKVFSFHYSIYGSLMQLSMFITGWLLETVSPQTIGSFLAICCIFVSLIWIFLFYSGKLNEPKKVA